MNTTDLNGAMIEVLDPDDNLRCLFPVSRITFVAENENGTATIETENEETFETVETYEQVIDKLTRAAVYIARG